MITAAQVDAEQELASLCGVFNASHARLVAIVAGALEDESWAIAGVRSPEHWLTMRAGLSPFRARQVVAVARRFGELPQVMGEFAGGQLSLDQVMVVARYAPSHVEASVAELAIHASVPQLRRALSRYSFDPPPEPGHQQGTTEDPRAGVGEPGTAGPDDTQAGEGGTGVGPGGVPRPGTVTPWSRIARPHPPSCRCPTTSGAGSPCGSAPQPTSARWSKPRSKKPKTHCSRPDARR